jgi:hypothetical protein
MSDKLHAGWAGSARTIARMAGWCVALFVVMGTLSVPADADSYNRHVRIYNHTSQAIYNIYGTNVNDSNFGPDRLGDDTVAPGASYEVNFDDGSGECLYDLKIVLRDHSEIIRRHINVCEIETWTVED